MLRSVDALTDLKLILDKNKNSFPYPFVPLRRQELFKIFFQGTPTTARVAITTRGLTPGVPTATWLAVGTEGQTAGIVISFPSIFSAP